MTALFVDITTTSKAVIHSESGGRFLSSSLTAAATAVFSVRTFYRRGTKILALMIMTVACSAVAVPS